LSGCLAAVAVPLLLYSFLLYYLHQKSASDMLPYHVNDVVNGVNKGHTVADQNTARCLAAKIPANQRAQASAACNGLVPAAAEAQCYANVLTNDGDVGDVQLCRENTQLGTALGDEKAATQTSLLCSVMPILQQCKAAAAAAVSGAAPALSIRTDNAFLQCTAQYLQTRRLTTGCGTQPRSNAALPQWSQCSANAVQADVPPAGNGPNWMKYCNGLAVQ